MSFPLAPANNQIALVNGIEYYWLASKGAWYRYGDATANVITANTFQALSSIIFPDGTSQTTAATDIDLYARTTANTATNNITILQGVDSTQNNSITAAFNKANSANVLAQAAFDYANTILSLDANIDTTARTTANNASSNTIIIQGVDLAQNTRLSIIEGVNTTQNANITIIQGVDLWQNTEITAASSLAQGAFARANSGARATTSNTTPTGNNVGDLWLSLTDETLYMYSYDGVSNNWVDISGPILRSSNIVVQYTITANVV